MLFGKDKKSTAAELLDELTEAEGAAAARVREIEQGIRDENARIAQAYENLDREALLASRERLADLNARLAPAQQAVAELAPKLQAARNDATIARAQVAQEKFKALALDIVRVLTPGEAQWREMADFRQALEREIPASVTLSDGRTIAKAAGVPNLDVALEVLFAPGGGLWQFKHILEMTWPGTLAEDDPVRRKLEDEREHLRSLQMPRAAPVYGSAWS